MGAPVHLLFRILRLTDGGAARVLVGAFGSKELAEEAANEFAASLTDAANKARLYIPTPAGNQDLGTGLGELLQAMGVAAVLHNIKQVESRDSNIVIPDASKLLLKQ